MPPASRFAELWSRSTIINRSQFPPKAKVSERPLFLKNCTEQLYAFQRKFAGPATFQLHDGPPYANGSLHVGHALNKILKDIINRYQVLKGTKVHYAPGWDCHGLPIELKALQDNKNVDNVASKAPKNAVAIRAAARKLALATIEEQKKTFQDWGIMADWKSAWTTMDPGFEIKQLEVFKKMVAKGLIQRRNKPVHWSPSTQTALAESELQYRDDHTSQAAFIAFPMVDDPVPALRKKGLKLCDVKALVWTTTPWTIPANQAIAVHPDVEYCIAVVEGYGRVIIAKDLVSRDRGYISKRLGLPAFRRNYTFRGSDLVGSTYRHPLLPKDAPPRPILTADWVGNDTGTGLVHCAPGHGMEDYKLGQAHGLATIAHVDDRGCFTEKTLSHVPALLQGKAVLDEGNETVISLLQIAGCLVGISPYTHKYPYDWRSKQPVIQRATPQWFADLTSIQEAAVSAINQAHFIPSAGKDRLLSFVQNRAEWCISRQRAWGVPIPALYHKDTDQAILTEESVAHVIKTIKSRGIEAWWTDSQDDPAWIPESLLGRSGENLFRRGSDTMDVWFDSGTTWTQIQEDKPRPGQPLADVYLEGSDQHRGWFQSSLLTFVAQSLHESDTKLSSAPFKTLITHGFTLDEQGRKMSKSEGNVVSPQEIMNPSLWFQHTIGKDSPNTHDSFSDQGPDALRLWVATSDYQKDVSVSPMSLINNSRTMKKFRMILKMLVSLQKDSNPPIPIVFNELTLIDRIALSHLRKLDAEVRIHYENYEFHQVTATINNYIRTDLSKFYIEAVKDRMYLDGVQSLSRLQGLAVLWEIFQRLLHRLSPIVPLLTEEAAHYMTQETGRDCTPLPWKDKHLHSHMASWEDAKLEEDMAVLFQAKSAVHALQEERRGKDQTWQMGSSLQCYVSMEFRDASDPAAQLMQTYSAEELEAFFVVSRVNVNATSPADAEWHDSAPVKVTIKGTSYDFTVHIHATTDKKCARCWKYVVPEEVAKELEDPLCERCMGTWTLAPYDQRQREVQANNPAWLEENMPRIQAATMKLHEEGAKEIDEKWKKFHWDAQLGKILQSDSLTDDADAY